jgi:sugar lactone lactonase YvrE
VSPHIDFPSRGELAHEIQRIFPPEHDANFTFGDADGKSLYLTASTGLYRVRVNVPGIRPGAVQQAATR